MFTVMSSDSAFVSIGALRVLTAGIETSSVGSGALLDSGVSVLEASFSITGSS